MAKKADKLKRSERVLLDALLEHVRDNGKRGTHLNDTVTVRVPLNWVLGRFWTSTAPAPRKLRAELGLGSRATCLDAVVSIWGAYYQAFEEQGPPSTIAEANAVGLKHAAERLEYLLALKVLRDHEGSIN